MLSQWAMCEDITPTYEVGTNVVTEGNGLCPQKNSRIDYPTLYFW